MNAERWPIKCTGNELTIYFLKKKVPIRHEAKKKYLYDGLISIKTLSQLDPNTCRPWKRSANVKRRIKLN